MKGTLILLSVVVLLFLIWYNYQDEREYWDWALKNVEL